MSERVFDAIGQEVVPITGRFLELRLNKIPAPGGAMSGRVLGCTKDIIWSNDSYFDLKRASAFAAKHNKSLSKKGVKF